MARPNLKKSRQEPGSQSKSTNKNPAEGGKAKKSGKKRVSGGEPTKHAHHLRATVDKRDIDGPIAEGQDRKRSNIGPSGQGAHRGRERRNKQSSASERPDVASIGSRRQSASKP